MFGSRIDCWKVLPIGRTPSSFHRTAASAASAAILVNAYFKAHFILFHFNFNFKLQQDRALEGLSTKTAALPFCQAKTSRHNGYVGLLQVSH